MKIAFRLNRTIASVDLVKRVSLGVFLLLLIATGTAYGYEVSLSPYYSSGDGTYSVTTLDSQQVWVPNSYLYFRVDDFPSGANAYVEITYYDESPSKTVSLQYDGVSSAYAVNSFHTRSSGEGSMAFVKSYRRLDDPLFSHRQNGGSDFRFSTGGMPVKSVVVRDTMFSDSDAAYALSLNPPWLSSYTGFSREDVNADSIKGKVVAGYQGWFRTPNDLYDKGFSHWTVDMWPDVSEYEPDSLRAISGAETSSGRAEYLFSSAYSSVVRKHFEWMRKYNIDGVYLQRFFAASTAGADPEWVLANVREAAHLEGRVWAIEYDLSGGTDATVYDKITTDWKWLVDEVGIREDSRYLYEQGKPVVVLWGAGIRTDMSAAVLNQLVDFFKSDPVYGNNYVVGCVSSQFPSSWDAHNARYDSIFAWMGSQQSVADHASQYGINAQVHVWPGFSWHNLFEEEFPYQYTDRAGGEFLWGKISNGISIIDPETVFVGMFDEYNESTAVMPMTDDPPVVPGENDYYYFLTNDGSPKDWWLTLSGVGNDMLNQHISFTTNLPSQTSLTNRSNIGQEVTVDLGAVNISDNLVQENPGDGPTTGDVVDGVTCRTATGNYIYFDISDSVLYQVSGGADVTIIVDYYDPVGADGLLLKYDSVSSSWSTHPKSFTTLGDGCWKSVRFEIEDGYFGNRENGADFRLHCSDMSIARVRVILPKAVPTQTGTVWNPGSGSVCWDSDASWTGGTAPGNQTQNFKVVFNVAGAQTCILDSQSIVAQLVVGDNGTTNGNNLRLTCGADLTCGLNPDGDGNWTAIGYNRPSTVTVESGAFFDAAANLLIGYSGEGSSSLDINGGIVNVTTTVQLGNTGNSSYGFVTVDLGGQLYADGLSIKNANCLVDVREGSIFLDGDKTSVINGYIASGLIKAYGGTGTLNVDYNNVTTPGQTIITATTPSVTTTTWNLGSKAWLNAANWTGGATPLRQTQNLKVVFNVTGALECVLEDDTVIAQLVVGDNGTTGGNFLTLADGADLTCGLNATGGKNWTAIGYNRPSTVTVESGAYFSTAAHLLLGFNGTGSSSLDIDGGIVDIATTIQLGNTSNTSFGLITVDSGGLLNSSGFSFKNTNSVIDVCNGVVLLDGDQTTAVNTYITNGNLIGYGGASTLNVDYNVTSLGQTAIKAVAP